MKYFSKLKDTDTKSILISFAVLAMMIPFQNCAKNNYSFTDSSVSDKLNFFEYRYEKPTEIYFDIHMVPTVDDINYQSYDLLGFSAASSGLDQPLDYEIEIFGVNDNSICPVKNGTILIGTTSFIESCTILKTIKIGYVLFKIKKTQGEWNVYKKIYNKN